MYIYSGSGRISPTVNPLPASTKYLDPVCITRKILSANTILLLPSIRNLTIDYYMIYVCKYPRILPLDDICL